MRIENLVSDDVKKKLGYKPKRYKKRKKKRTCIRCHSNDIRFDVLKSGIRIEACLNCGLVKERAKPKDLSRKDIEELMGIRRDIYVRKSGAIRRK